MGWCNYIIISKLKLIVEALRHLNEEKAKYFLENFEEFIEKAENFNYVRNAHQIRISEHPKNHTELKVFVMRF